MIDLHMHTTHSDGTDTVETLLEKAEKNGLEMISITDHDSVEAYFELEEHPEIRKKFQGEIVIGSEIKTTFDDVNIEILAYGIDYHKIQIKTENRNQVQNDILRHCIEVAKGLGMRVDDNIRTDSKDSNRVFAGWVFCDNILQYPENEKIINSLGNMNRINFYREHEGNKNSPFYYNTSKYFDDYQTVIDKIHEAGGLAFLAHGLIYSYEDKRAAVDKIAKTTNIDGLECIYPLFDEDGRMFMKNICKKYNKLMSGGSDYHAKNKPTTFMGTGINHNIRVEKEFVRDWINRVRKI